ncbi:hypothetical protein C6497_02445 [Candidatus Poribacteria bacterium]|nr:MAG: hypothetical protein C6497_02445 [Candidatus Poribacteria bacterium]
MDSVKSVIIIYDMKISRKKLILIILLTLLGIILLLSVIYQKTALWKPEQSLITLLPKSPLCYLTLKELEGLVKTFNESEFGEQSRKMPLISYIRNQLWWRQLVYQKLVWEAEMGGKLDMDGVNGHFGTEAIMALYQREGELSFLLITEVGGPEKLGIEAITATDAINPKYERIQREYKGLTINTITGYPRDFSYTFIGKIGVLSLSPILVAEVIDNFTQQANGFLESHPFNEKIIKSYDQESNTAYLDISGMSLLVGGSKDYSFPIVEQILPMIKDYDYCTIGNHYSDGMIYSQLRLGEPDTLAIRESKSLPASLPKQTAIRVFNPQQDLTMLWNTVRDGLKINSESDLPNFTDLLKGEMTIGMIAHTEGEDTKFPSVVISVPILDRSVFDKRITSLDKTNLMISGKALEFLEPEEYSGITIQPVKLRLHFLLSLVGGYAVINDEFVFSTTLNGMREVIDTRIGNKPELSELRLPLNDDVIYGYIQPELLIPEVRRLLPLISLLMSLSGQKIDLRLIQQLRDNLFPLEYLGPITVAVNKDEKGIEANIEIDLEK